ncbi:glutamate--tRNA ligase [Methanobrevibacter boviskoreani]|uniref:glutamate--tRNA ligase n=1 Tax=Methanobrevibacter boviskoreani TaxID=1348249 RepID=UPI0023A88BA2|nr:glutamate--tRNA ligase [Methanobrevibacter boviskoreani]MCI6774475.1 glutamate--tRNA ligase [Methanobrevibacter boviskoreani]MCI6929689.1 glutamate--tRNA ligase [Methanobrevibacter boviskoreani]MDY5613992.1 glutamate--tRNA ligase [Methanobrevibacter boviskoreani]
MDELEEVVYKHALMNAVKHKGSASPKAVMGSIMSQEAELRSRAKEIGPLSAKIVAKVNELSKEEQQAEMDKLGLEIHEKKQVKKEGLDELPGSHDNVVMRFAPNPSGPLHIGHARAAVPNGEYVKKYGGKFILRIEDTDPKRVYPPAYDMIQEDLKWLGIEPDEVYFQSDRFEIYYKYAEELIKRGAAYMCTCDGGEFKKLKDNCQPCPHRNQSVEENLKLWEQFPSMEAGSAVLRIKTDINHKNPAIRDWVAFRIVDEEHPRLGKKYRVYPMMNFSVSVDDHLMGMTHVLRGKDHLANSEKQKYLYKHMGWDTPEFIHYGRLKMEDIPLSTSKAKEGIESGKYSSWTDPRLGTLRAIARRGIQPEAIWNLMVEIGVKMSDSAVSWKKIYGLNRNVIEDKANRYFFVKNPVKIDVEDCPEEFSNFTLEKELHPDFPERGNRTLDFNGSVYIDGDDFKDGHIRLMDLINIDIDNGTVKFNSASFEDARKIKARIIQFVPTEEAIKAEVVMDDASVVEGFCEKDCKNLEVDDVIQFERFGFVRLDEIKDDKLVFYYAHK